MAAPPAQSRLHAREVADKLAVVRRWLGSGNAGAVRLRGIDWFAWATAGGSSAVQQSAESGVAEVLVSAAEACILTDEIEADRLRDEEVGALFSFHVTPWDDSHLREHFVQGLAGGRPVLSDRPVGAELALPAAARNARLVLSAPERERYRLLGALSALAMTEALRAARPDWSAWQLAGAGAQALWRRGVYPALVLAAGERRLPLYRHPTPANEPLGRDAMLVFCARRHGLHANLTRCVAFGHAPPRMHELLDIEATGLAACVPGNSLASVYHAFEQAYRHANAPGAIREHHQGGVTGYQSRELLASATTALALAPGMALAFNPSLTGNKLEDTFLLGPDGLENITFDPAWPATTAHGRMRPLWLESPW
ncbi:peptidase M24 [Massilia glaciei]|uniref:Peptidase M24 n=2 Tax=Massilia glaciei TaxID=1524097 RepID=A0A2U2I4Z7_9BURK|nr:peptidase M24 [Massilia glaciei]